MVIVCGTDLSERSKPAQRAAAAIATRMGAGLCLVYVADPELSYLAPTVTDDVREAAIRRLDAHVRELQERFGASLALDAVVLSDAESPSIAQTLVRFADERRADLLVVSSQGHGASPLVSLGGTSERVAQLATLPVIVVRDERPFLRWAEEGRALRVLLGVDSSATSYGAIGFAKRLRNTGPCDVLVGHVYYVSDAVRRYGWSHRVAHTEVDPELESLIARDLATATGTFPGQGEVRFRPILGLGRLGDHLLSVADAEVSDLIVVGTRQGKGLRRLTSVSSVVLHHGHASIACIPSHAVARATQTPQMRRVLVPTDLSASGNAAVGHGYALVAGPAGEVHLAHAVPPEDQRSDAEIAAQLRELAPETEGETITRTHVLRTKDVPRAIHELSERLGVDAICLAAKPRTTVAHALFGSLTEKVARESSRPLLLVKPPAP